ncbi:MAG TPA: hypothetical protein VFU16_09310 [Solirubrobacterales bacterium]|nr:hypothetical protein [Solirubrobacterales bacterium]
MEHRQQGLEPRKGTRRRRGRRLTKASWRLARRDPTLVPLSLLGIGCFTLVSIATIGLITGFDGPEDGAQILLASIVGGFVSTGVFVLFSVAVAQAASGGFDGQPLTMREALSEARLTTGPIALWTLIALSVALCLQLLGATGDGGRLLGGGLSLVWAFLVAFVIPIIALTGAGAGDAISESAAVARRRWVEQLSGGIAILVLAVAASLGWGILCGFGASAIDHDRDALGALALVIGVTGLIFTLVLSFATAQAFTVALYRLDGGELSLDELESPPAAAPIGRSAVFRVAGIIAGLLVMATLVGALVPNDNRRADADLGNYTPENGWYYATFGPGARVPLAAGSPVVYNQRQVGVVVESRLEPGRVVVWFRAAPALEDPIQSNPKTVGGFSGRHYLQVGPRDGPDGTIGPA